MEAGSEEGERGEGGEGLGAGDRAMLAVCRSWAQRRFPSYQLGNRRFTQLFLSQSDLRILDCYRDNNAVR